MQTQTVNAFLALSVLFAVFIWYMLIFFGAICIDTVFDLKIR